MDFADPEFVRDPYPALSRLRARAPAHTRLRSQVARAFHRGHVVTSAILLLNAGMRPRCTRSAMAGWPCCAPRPAGPATRGPVTAAGRGRGDAPLRPALHLFVRTAAADVEIAGVTIPAGAEVAALLGAANRDPAVFADPDSFDVGRDPNPHVSFGAGLHFCLGAPLARLELQAALAALLDRAPELALAAEPVQRPTFVRRAYTAVRVTTAGQQPSIR